MDVKTMHVTVNRQTDDGLRVRMTLEIDDPRMQEADAVVQDVVDFLDSYIEAQNSGTVSFDFETVDTPVGAIDRLKGYLREAGFEVR